MFHIFCGVINPNSMNDLTNSAIIGAKSYPISIASAIFLSIESLHTRYSANIGLYYSINVSNSINNTVTGLCPFI